MAAMNARSRTRRDELAWLAWHTAALPLLKKFPSLEQLTGKPKRRQSDEEMKAYLMASIGGKRNA